MAFDDALSLLSYRYSYNYNSLATANQLIPDRAANVFPYDNIDGYSDGPLHDDSGAGISDSRHIPGYILLLPWSGADNTNHFFDLQELFNPNETSAHSPIACFPPVTLSTRPTATPPILQPLHVLPAALADGRGIRAGAGKINLNYVQRVCLFQSQRRGHQHRLLPDAETNLVPWTPLQFFTNAADRMLRDYSQEWLVESPSNYVATYSMTTNISTAANPAQSHEYARAVWHLGHSGAGQQPVCLYARRPARAPARRQIYDATTNNTLCAGR